MPHQMKKFLYYLSLLLLCVAIFLIAYRMLFGWPDESKGRKQVIELYKNLDIGMFPELVRETCHGAKFQALRLFEISATNWIIQTPMSMGAVNWDIRLSFGTNGLDAVRIRLADSEHMPPHAAPPDKVRVWSNNSSDRK